MDAPEDLITFCSRQQPRLVGALTLYCGDGDLAEELAQEALARACNKWSHVRKMDAPEAWVYRVAINLTNSHFRRKAAEMRARQRLKAEGRRVTVDPDVVTSVSVMDAVARLSRRQRAALVLRYYADLSIVEVAELMNCPEGTVKTLTHKAARSLREILGREDLEEVAHGA